MFVSPVVIGEIRHARRGNELSTSAPSPEAGSGGRDGISSLDVTRSWWLRPALWLSMSKQFSVMILNLHSSHGPDWIAKKRARKKDDSVNLQPNTRNDENMLPRPA